MGRKKNNSPRQSGSSTAIPSPQAPPPRFLLPDRRGLVILLAALALPLFFCASQLNLDFWYDEAFTILSFVSKGIETIATDYSCPNNHLFYLMLLTPFYALSGSNFVLRLPSFFIALGTLLLIYRILRRHISPGAGVLGLTWLGLTEIFLNHAMQLRGYGLSMLLAVVLGDLATRFESNNWRLRILTTVALTCFLYTLPSNVIFAVPIAASAMLFSLKRDAHPKTLFIDMLPWLIGPVLAGLCYLPILDQILSATSSTGNRSYVFGFFMEELDKFTRDAHWLWGILPLGVVIWGLRLRKEGKRESTTSNMTASPALSGHSALLQTGMARFLFPGFLVICIIGPFVILWILGNSGLFFRNLTPGLPFFALLAGWLSWEILEGIRNCLLAQKHRWVTEAAGLVLFWLIFLPALFSYPARLSAFRETTFAQDGYYNYYTANFHAAAPLEYLKANISPDENYAVLNDRAGYFNLDYYFQRLNFPRQRIENKKAQGGTFLNLYYIAPTLINYEDLKAHSGISSETLSQFPVVRDFGYYKLHKSPQPLRLDAPAKK